MSQIYNLFFLTTEISREAQLTLVGFYNLMDLLGADVYRIPPHIGACAYM